MAKSKKEQTLPIAELLPEGLSEAAISEIANLVNTVISEQVNEKIHELEAKVKGFMRLRVDELKDQAMRELREENSVARNAAMFESVKTLMALELGKDDEENAISNLVQEQKEFEFLGRHVRQGSDLSVHVDQHAYVNNLKAVHVPRARLSIPEASLTSNEMHDYRSFL